ncbi:MAG TPA: ABC transporter permease [Pyrinomonadaceae bacterium]|nr:ABC transporter permease [Pyrinomonadaceae bacterium]
MRIIGGQFVLQFFIRKIVQGILLLLITSAAAFFLLSSAGSDAFTSLRENPQVSAAAIEKLRASYGLDRPVIERYGSWLASAARADLGDSFYYQVPVAQLVLARFWSTAVLAFAAIGIACLIAVTLAFLNARFRSRTLSVFTDGIILVFSSTPRIVISLLALAILVYGAITSVFWLSAISLSVPLVALLLAQFNQSLQDAMLEDFVRTARAKGLSETVIILRHAFRAAINPALTVFGLSLGALLGGSVIVETVIGRPGIGSLTVTAVRNRDIPLLMGVMIVVSIAVWAGNSLAEVLQFVNDKRLKSQEGE